MSDFPVNFPESRLTFSDTAVRNGIDNTLPAALRENLIRLAHFLTLIESWLHAEFPSSRLYVTSGYRCHDLNVKVGGSDTSDHSVALAADLQTTAMTPQEFAKWLKSKLTDYKQIILEFGKWVHVSLPQLGIQPKREVLTAVKHPNTQGVLKTVYLPGIVENEPQKS